MSQFGPAALADACFSRIAALMYREIGLSLSEAKKSLVASRLGPRLQKLGIDDYSDYIDLVEAPSSSGELQVAIDLLTTNETYFFREPAHFDALQAYVAQKRHSIALKVWSAACSYGDEAYSIAMLLSDLQDSQLCQPGWSILATDISHRVLVNAKEAVYPEDRLRHVEAARLKKYCLKGDGPAQGLVMMGPRVRSAVKFAQVNLCQKLGAEIGMFDVIFLRNVLIYFDAQTRKTVMDKVVQCLLPGGLLILGTAEGRNQGSEKLLPVTTGVFQKPV
jgi:chemotaxis protein methyltransferase CheR